MAPKKSKNAVMDRGATKVMLGTPVRIIAMGDSVFTCPVCAKTLKNGIVYRHDSAEYCSRHCIPKPAQD